MGVIGINMKKFIAERVLLYSLKGKQDRNKLIIKISEPYLLEKGAVNFAFDHGSAGCRIELEGLNESSIDVHGIDMLHALTLAVDIDPYLKNMENKYDFFWLSGESYFEKSG